MLPFILNIFILKGSQSTLNLDGCVGRLELHFNQPGSAFCQIEKIACRLSLIVSTILSSNVLETFLLYKCFQNVKNQTEKSRHMINDKDYILRKR